MFATAFCVPSDLQRQQLYRDTVLGTPLPITGPKSKSTMCHVDEDAWLSHRCFVQFKNGDNIFAINKKTIFLKIDVSVPQQ